MLRSDMPYRDMTERCSGCCIGKHRFLELKRRGYNVYIGKVGDKENWFCPSRHARAFVYDILVNKGDASLWLKIRNP